ncbi:MAG TPA: 3-hydroxyacyl-ACP dehydratase FabZ [Candidatus Eremiobacteraceae bacterium]|jgi:3-hydroxyacyl-[acyl-carrier-protein] dehydratase|nr:3-hydroxyacyl-ACP dehydratase FabZ [Candidatus Eremiobacteraceae bacterium]
MRTVPTGGGEPLHRADTGDKQVAYLDIRSIMDILPHRYPFLLIDRITELVPQKRAVGYKNITLNEWFFSGHFPNNPVMPGVLIIEAMAQLGGTAILEPNTLVTTVPYLAGVDKLKFRRPVVPGDKLEMEANVMWIRMNIGRLQASARVDDQTVCEGELLFSIVSDTRLFRHDAAILHM